MDLMVHGWAWREDREGKCCDYITVSTTATTKSLKSAVLTGVYSQDSIDGGGRLVTALGK